MTTSTLKCNSYSVGGGSGGSDGSDGGGSSQCIKHGSNKRSDGIFSDRIQFNKYHIQCDIFINDY